jgi:biopolymer transport protein ExbB/biopolymer transport protein TolQ
MGILMSGIAEALVATGVGLFVALPAVVAYNVAQKRIAGIESDTLAHAKLITAALRTPASGATADEGQISGERSITEAAE